MKELTSNLHPKLGAEGTFSMILVVFKDAIQGMPFLLARPQNYSSNHEQLFACVYFYLDLFKQKSHFLILSKLNGGYLKPFLCSSRAAHVLLFHILTYNFSNVKLLSSLKSKLRPVTLPCYEFDLLSHSFIQFVHIQTWPTTRCALSQMADQMVQR